MRDFARDRRWPIVAGATRKAEAIVAASSPRTVCSISGARTASIDRAMGADEHQRQPLVRDFGFGVVRGFLGEQLQMRAGRLARPIAPTGVQQRGGERPSAARLAGCPARRPPASRPGLPRRPRTTRPRPRRRPRCARRSGPAACRSCPERPLPRSGWFRSCRHGRVKAHCTHADIGQIGRTSIAPVAAPGHRSAQDSAASRSCASIR